MQSFGIQVDMIDPYADAEQVQQYYGCTLATEATGVYDAIVVATKHTKYENLSEEFFKKLVNPPFVLFDLKSLYGGKFQNVEYFSL